MRKAKRECIGLFFYFFIWYRPLDELVKVTQLIPKFDWFLERLALPTRLRTINLQDKDEASNYLL